MNRMTIGFSPIVLLGFALIAACGSGHDDDDVTGAVNPFVGYTSEQYSNSANWLCHAGLATADNVCAANLDATIVFADGTTELEPFEPLAEPPVDCFYVYPTVSSDSSGNSDLIPDEERFVVVSQAARYSAVCRVFAPLYRQVTVTALFSDIEGDFELAYGDVVDAFKHYMANENNGRGFVLIGHSQGTGHLRRLIAEEIETDSYLLDRLIAAHLIGLTVEIPKGADVGATFQQVPVCRKADETACVVSYASFRNTDPLLADAVFGVTDDESTEAVCTNPAALAGGSATLDAYFNNESIPALDAVLIQRAPGGPFADESLRDTITTPFYKMPDFLLGECKISPGGANILQVTAQVDADDPRADDFNGEFTIGPGWGLHLVDINLGMGNLVELAATQSQSWLQDNN
nr:esterase/lipase [uncultured bacterium]